MAQTPEVELPILTIRELDELVPTLTYVKAWVKAVEDEITLALEQGAEFENAYLEPKRAFRKWGVEDVLVARMLKDALGALGKDTSDDVVAPRSVVSPAQAEKLIGKKAFGESKLPTLVTAESSGFNLKLR